MRILGLRKRKKGTRVSNSIKNLKLYALLLISFNITAALQDAWVPNYQVLIYRPAGLTDKSSQSFFLPRPLFDNVAAKQALWHNIIHNRDEQDKSGSWQLITLFQDTLSTDRMKRYFLFDCKTSLTVKGDNYSGTRDIRAEWLGINNTNFNSVLSIDPHQQQFGFVAEYQHAFKKIIDWNLFDQWWVGFSLPVVIVEQNMQLSEAPVTTTTGMNLRQAFNQCDWKYNKIDGKQTRAGVPEIMFTLGTNMLNRKHSQVGIYSGLIVPTSHRACPDYLFSPILGHNRHWGMSLGLQFQLRLSDEYSPDYCVAFFANVENQFFFRNYQYRTFDLIDKPWSRYLQFNANDGRKNLPGVNVLTRWVKVHPFNIVDLSTGFRLKAEHFEGEVGYNLWGHGNERVLLRCPFPETYGIAGRGTSASNCPTVIGNVGATASASTIAELCDDDEIFTPIKDIDLDLLSAVSRSAVTHKFHTSIGYHWKNGAFAGVGAFFEGVRRDVMFEEWGVWFKLGANI